MRLQLNVGGKVRHEKKHGLIVSIFTSEVSYDHTTNIEQKPMSYKYNMSAELSFICGNSCCRNFRSTQIKANAFFLYIEKQNRRSGIISNHADYVSSHLRIAQLNNLHCKGTYFFLTNKKLTEKSDWSFRSKRPRVRGYRLQIKSHRTTKRADDFFDVFGRVARTFKNICWNIHECLVEHS